MNDAFSSTIITLLLLAALAFMLGKRRLGFSLLGCAGAVGTAAIVALVVALVMVVAVVAFLFIMGAGILGACGAMVNH